MRKDKLKLGGEAGVEPSKGGKKKVAAIMVFIIGVIALVVGIVFLVISLNQGPTIEDGEYLVTAGEWALNDGTNCGANGAGTNCVPSVIWDFTEIGKGTLTTNGHVNDYDFIWALEDGRLLIETDWLYTLEDEYNYKLDREAGVLTLQNGDKTVTLLAIPNTEE